MSMSSYHLFVTLKSRKTPLQERYDSKAAADEALAQLVADLKSDGIAISKGGGISLTRDDFKTANVRPGYANPIVGPSA
jgi:hypothetical protein